MQNWRQLYETVVSGEAQSTCTLTGQALGAGAVPLTLVNDAMMPAMAEADLEIRDTADLEVGATSWRQLSDPITNQFHRVAIHDRGRDVRHAAVAEFGHAINNHGAVRIARRQNLCVVDAEISVLRHNVHNAGLLQR